jgi:hypothetical protein
MSTTTADQTRQTATLPFDHGLSHKQLYILGEAIDLEADLYPREKEMGGYTRTVHLDEGAEITLLEITVPYHRYVFKVRNPLGSEEVIEVYSRRLPSTLVVEE